MIIRNCILFLCLQVAVHAAEEFKFSVSDLLADTLEPMILEYNAATEDPVELISLGTLPAMEQLDSNQIDMAVIAVPTDSMPPRDRYLVYPLAYSVSIVVLNSENPTNELSLSELGGIFGSSEEMQLQNWGELGLAGWGNRSLKPMATQKEGSITLELFKHEVLKAGGMKASVLRVNNDELSALIGADLATIGVTTQRPDKRGIKELMVSTTKDSPAYEASRDNVHFGDYPIRLPYYIVFDAQETERAKALLQKLFSDEVAVRLESNGFVALPDTVRRKLLIDLELTR